MSILGCGFYLLSLGGWINMYKGDVTYNLILNWSQLTSASTTELYASPCRHLWNWFRYIFFFYNAIVGIVASIVRIFLSVTISLLLLFRLDAVIFMKGFESMNIIVSRWAQVLTLCPCLDPSFSSLFCVDITWRYLWKWRETYKATCMSRLSASSTMVHRYLTLFSIGGLKV